MKCTFNILVSLNLFLTIHIYFYLFRGNVEADLQKSFNNCSENVSETFLHKSKFNFIKKKKMNALVKR